MERVWLRGHTVSAVNFEAAYTVCENKEGCENSLPSKIPRVPYTESVDLSSSVAALVDIVPDTQKLLTCQYVKEAFESAVPLCDETISNLTYRGGVTDRRYCVIRVMDCTLARGNVYRTNTYS